MHYLLIVLSVVMFGGCFKLNDVYREIRGSSFRVSQEFILISALSAVPILFILGGFKLEATPFTIVMASLCAINGIAFSYFSFMALGKINLSLYSLFSMLGGMTLPFLQGLLFYGEPLSVAKAVCFVFITAALVLTVKPGEGKGGLIYYAGIFVLNGMSGVLSKIFVSAEYPKTDSTIYSMWGAIITVILAAVSLLVIRCFGKGEPARFSAASVGVAVSSGVVNKIANLILVISLAFVDTSIQYPMVTGGVIIVSTLGCFIGKSKRPSRNEIISVGLAFVGTLCLFLIPV